MGRADDAHPSLRALGFEQRQLVAPAREVVHLIDVDTAAEEAHGVVNLALAFGRG